MPARSKQSGDQDTVSGGHGGHNFLNTKIPDYIVRPPYPVSRRNGKELLGIYGKYTGKDYPGGKMDRRDLSSVYETVRSSLHRNLMENLELVYDHGTDEYKLVAFSVLGETTMWMPVGNLLHLCESEDPKIRRNATALRSMARLMHMYMGFANVLAENPNVDYYLGYIQEENPEETAWESVEDCMLLDEYWEYAETRGYSQDNIIANALSQLKGCKKEHDTKTALAYEPMTPDDTMGSLIREGLAWLEKGYNIAETLYGALDLSQFENQDEDDDNGDMDPMGRFLEENWENGYNVIRPEDSIGFSAFDCTIEDMLKDYNDNAGPNFYLSDFYEYDLSPQGNDRPQTEKGNFLRWVKRFADRWNTCINQLETDKPCQKNAKT